MDEHDRRDLRRLPAELVRLTRDAFGRLRLEIGIEERHEPVRVVRCLPLTKPDSFLSLQDEEGEEIGLLEETSRLEPESRRLLVEELQLSYLKARVQGVRRITPRQGLMSWELETELGPRTVYIRDRSDIRAMPDGYTVLTDVHGAKYVLPPLDELDERSRAFVEVEL